MNLPYSCQQGEKLCSAYKHLKGTSFGSDNAIIECIAVTPYDINHKQRFFLYYLLFDNDAVAALQEYKGKLYDVTIIAKNEEGEIVYENFLVWASKNKLVIDFPNDTSSPFPSTQLYI